MAYYSYLKRNKFLKHALTWMNFDNMLTERSQTRFHLQLMLELVEGEG